MLVRGRSQDAKLVFELRMNKSSITLLLSSSGSRPCPSQLQKTTRSKETLNSLGLDLEIESITTILSRSTPDVQVISKTISCPAPSPHHIFRCVSISRARCVADLSMLKKHCSISRYFKKTSMFQKQCEKYCIDASLIKLLDLFYQLSIIELEDPETS